ncbi:hypothetical protein HMPREF3213_02228 [Heyndrickxia coagulans]|uniref:Uncharacterized protein n=1 Tax=Heyndrickxia coagulans TaxID=1398 RepID=A0A133KMF8_HEYCO|nr:hypothetical protein HMPREF3213_02228 [Heyndrickxia coagulans]
MGRKLPCIKQSLLNKSVLAFYPAHSASAAMFSRYRLFSIHGCGF